MENDKLEFGHVVWYLDPASQDVVYGIDGTDNTKFYSFEGVRDGVVAHPEHLNHYDIWFTNNYTLPQVKGFVNVRNASEESFEIAAEDIKTKFDNWSRNLVAGRISKDRMTINIIAQVPTEPEVKRIAAFFLKNELLSPETMIYWNLEQTLSVKDLFSQGVMNAKPQCSDAGRGQYYYTGAN